MFTVSDCHRAHLQMSQKSQTRHDWFLIDCGSLANQKGHGFMTYFSKSGKPFNIILLTTISSY